MDISKTNYDDFKNDDKTLIKIKVQTKDKDLGPVYVAGPRMLNAMKMYKYNGHDMAGLAETMKKSFSDYIDVLFESFERVMEEE